MHTKLIIVLVAICFAGLGGIAAAVAQTDDVAVVVSEKNPVANFTQPELRKIFAGEKRSWAGGQPIRLFVRAPGAHERAVLLKLLDMSESEYKKYWAAQVFRGEAQAEPVALFSNGMQKEALTTFPGAIALVNFQDVKPGMKIVKVDGHSPTEREYPLR
jgi:ABC-type phosphate transport system substrate-binding protein